MRHRTRPDANQDELVTALLKLGADVRRTNAVCPGFPDLVIAVRGDHFLAEVKAPRGEFTPDQLAFYGTWLGVVYVLRTYWDAVNLINGDRHLIERWSGGRHLKGVPR